MISPYTVCFFGHRVLSDPLCAQRRLTEAIRLLLREEAYVEFLVGRNREFDLLASSALQSLRRISGFENCSHTPALPYGTAQCRDHPQAYPDHYDAVQICESAVPYKTAFSARNRRMVDRSDLVICWVAHRGGGAYQAASYAARRRKPLWNLADPRWTPRGFSGRLPE